MGWYADYIFPRILEWTLNNERLAEERRRALADAHGDVLEIGFGTGLNLPHYPTAVRSLTAVDPSRMLERRVRRRIDDAPFPVEVIFHDAARLPLDAGRFDCAVTTWTLCSIAEVAAALAEIRRVLRPGGSYLFLEHGRSDEPKIARWQDRLNPLWRYIGVGCNLNRPIDAIVRAADFEFAHLERYTMPGMPRFAAPHYLGRAVVA